jgi:predicted NBD/HSP70 family sugar kinase
VRIGAVTAGQQSESIHRANLSAIMRTLHEHGSRTRSELVLATGLTRSTIRLLVAELVVGGFATERPATLDGTPGRPSPLVVLNPTGAVVIALEIAVDSLAAAVVGLGGEVAAHIREALPPERTSLDEVVTALAALAARVTTAIPAESQVIGYGVAVVGVVRRSDGMVSMAPNLGWRDQPLGERLAQVLEPRRPIIVANESDLAALAELRRGAGVGYDDLILIWGSVGVGGGIVVGGEALIGADGYSGEVGHIPVDPDGLPCRCGSNGCWETVVGSGALLRRAGQEPDSGAPSVDAVRRAAERGDPTAMAAFAETGRWLGIGLAGLINVLDPRLVLLGGRLAGSFPFVLSTLEAELDRRVQRAIRHLVKVIPATLGPDAPLLGAAELALDTLIDDPVAWLRDRAATVEAISA